MSDLKKTAPAPTPTKRIDLPGPVAGEHPPTEPARYHPEVEAVAPRDEEPPSTPRPARRHVGPTEDQLQGLADSLKPKEQERLIAILQQRLGLVGKAPTGKWIAKLGIMLDARPGQAKAQRIRPGTVLADLTAEEIDLFKGQGAIEPEYS